LTGRYAEAAADLDEGARLFRPHEYILTYFDGDSESDGEQGHF
jgi:hypothetical protein